jgi:PAB1-binding protein PBP1
LRRGARIAHYLTQEKATKVEVTLIVPKLVSRNTASTEGSGITGNIFGVCPPALNGTTWTIKWNSVDQNWEVDSSHTTTEQKSATKNCPYKTTSDIPVEYRAQGVRLQYAILEFADDPADASNLPG